MCDGIIAGVYFIWHNRGQPLIIHIHPKNLRTLFVRRAQITDVTTFIAHGTTDVLRHMRFTSRRTNGGGDKADEKCTNRSNSQLIGDFPATNGDSTPAVFLHSGGGRLSSDHRQVFVRISPSHPSTSAGRSPLCAPETVTRKGVTRDGKVR